MILFIMSHNSESMDELYSYLFAVRISLQDIYESESDIIRELKNYLIDTGQDPNTINQTLHDFYQYYGINIPLYTIEQVSVINNQILNNMLGFMLNADDFDNSNELDQEQEQDDQEQDDQEQDQEQDQDQDDQEQDDQEQDDQEQDDQDQEQNEQDDQDQEQESGQFLSIQLTSNGPEYTFTSHHNLENILGQINQAFSANISSFPSNFIMAGTSLNSHNHMLNMLNSLINGFGGITTMANTFQDVVVTVDDNDLQKLKSTKLESKLDVDCSICMGQMDKDEMITELKCSHTFHTECIEPYLKQYNYKCPICRSEVGKTKYNI